eukprot:SAG11_NODE_19034_length_475_cov_1.651596_1_plen_119_part_00
MLDVVRPTLFIGLVMGTCICCAIPVSQIKNESVSVRQLQSQETLGVSLQGCMATDNNDDGEVTILDLLNVLASFRCNVADQATDDNSCSNADSTGPNGCDPLATNLLNQMLLSRDNQV